MWRRKVSRSRKLGKATKLQTFWKMVMALILYNAEIWPVT